MSPSVDYDSNEITCYKEISSSFIQKNQVETKEVIPKRFKELGWMLVTFNEIGPSVFLSSKGLEFLENIPKALTRLAVYYQIAVGQGNCYNCGIYGSFPVLKTGSRALVYASFLDNQSFLDPRFKGKNYFLYVLFFDDSDYCFPLSDLEEECSSTFRGITLSQVQPKLMNNLAFRMRKSVNSKQ